MISNCNLCYMPNVCPNENLYIVVQNIVSGLSLNLVIQYIYKKELVTRQSPIFNCGQKVEVPFPKDAKNIHFFVVRHYGSETHSIAEIYLKSDKTTCFLVHGTVQAPNCTEIPCS